MTDKELEALAREYAESNIPNGVDENYSRSIIYSDGEMFGRFLRWLSERYEIVNKERIREEYNKIQQRIEENKILASHSEFYPEIERAETFVIMDEKQVRLLKSLFPQTLKSEEI